MLWGIHAEQWWLVILTLLVMGVSFAGGAWFAMRVPDTHLAELRETLKHGEIVLMVDVAAERISEIESLIEHRHPETVPGGTGWTIAALGI